MALASLLDHLEYSTSPNYLRRDNGTLDHDHGHAHIFRKAMQDCKLHGVYALRPQTGDTVVPIVYVCEAHDEADADRIHKLVWNQNIVPFLLVTMPRGVRLYSGFRYQRTAENDDARGVIRAASTFRQIAAQLDGFSASAIDSGAIWQNWGEYVTPEHGVDWTLLKYLDNLDHWLREHHLDKDTSHALIGKYVYLHYLRDRNILSHRKLERWGIAPATVFGRQATPDGFWALIARLDEWLNGAIFPISAEERAAILPEHITKVAGTFEGDDPVSGQYHLDFTAFDFSFLPIEVLSTIYQQFLHAETDDGQPTLGKKAGAYYTPIPLVNFMLDELDDQRPLREGMRVFDPSCGSGAFLVQCYRRLIERHLSQMPDGRPTPGALRALLEQHIFGVDRDADACRVAELSLILTLLDYVDPPDLEPETVDAPTAETLHTEQRFKLPSLYNRNIFHADFFDPTSCWAQRAEARTYDWIVGNPPWVTVNRARPAADDQHAWQWMYDHRRVAPVGGHQVAEAFAWKVMDAVAPDGIIGLLLPAMTLFKDESRPFREAFFRQTHVWSVANFANFAYILFAGRSQRPAASFFYSPRTIATTAAPEDLSDTTVIPEDETLLYYAPFVANQLANRPTQPGKQVQTWNIVVNANEVRQLPIADILSGDMLPWKIAMWGSLLDRHLLEKLGRRYPTLEQYADQHHLMIRQGFPLREAAAEADETIAYTPELVGQYRVDFDALRNQKHLFAFPSEALFRIPATHAYLRVRSGRGGLTVSQPPHIIVDAARRFAIYSDEFIAVQQPHLGIAGAPDTSAILKALTLLLNSDFALYHQFFTSPEWGIDSIRATRASLMQLPVPLEHFSDRDLREWGELHDALVACSDGKPEHENGLLHLVELTVTTQLTTLLDQVNTLVAHALRLSPSEQWSINDFVTTRMPLIKGKVNADALTPPSPNEMEAYARILKDELDAFIRDFSPMRHAVTLVTSPHNAMLGIDLRQEAPADPVIVQADAAGAREIDGVQRALLQQRSQWVYFHRTLRIYEGTQVFVAKPLLRMHWTKSQAMLDAGDIIAETITGTGA